MSISIWRRILWHVYRTPAARTIKSLRRTAVRSSIKHRRALGQSLAVSEVQHQHARMLNREGYAIVTDAMDPQAVHALSEAGAAKLNRAREGPVTQHTRHKDFWTRLLDEDMEAGMLPSNNPFVAFALQPSVLSILSTAYGELPRLDYVLLTLSRHTGKALSYSQLWHRDYDDTRVIKLFVYLTDVASQDDGPFTFIPGPSSDRFGFSLHSHRPDDAIAARLGSSDQIKSIKAPRLSAFMVETSRCLHMGSRLAAGHERLLYTATYISVPRLFPEPPPLFRLTGTENDVVRCVLSPQ